MWNKVWAALGDETREHLLREFVRTRIEPEFEPLLAQLARTRRTRTRSILKLDEAQFSRQLRPVLAQAPLVTIAPVLPLVLFEKHRAAIEALHTALNWPPTLTAPETDGDLADGPSTGGVAPDSDLKRAWYDPTDEQLAAARPAVEAAGPPDIWLLILTGLLLKGITPGIQKVAEKALLAAIEHAARRPARGAPSGGPSADTPEAPTVSVAEQPPQATTDAAQPDPADAADPAELSDAVPHASHSHRYTEIDRLLTEHIVTILLTRGIEGDEFEKAEHVVSLFTTLTRARPASFFHRGFLDGIAAREFNAEIPGANESRRLWYAHGYLMGVERIGGGLAAIDAFERIKAGSRLRFQSHNAPDDQQPVRSAIADQLFRIGLEHTLPERLCEATRIAVEVPPDLAVHLLTWCMGGVTPRHAEERLVVAKWLRGYYKYGAGEEATSSPVLLEMTQAAIVAAMRCLGRFDGVGTPHPDAGPRLRVEHLFARLRIGAVETMGDYRLADWRQRANAIKAIEEELRPFSDHDALSPMLLALPTVFAAAAERTAARRLQAIADLDRSIGTMGGISQGSPWLALQRLAELWRDALRACSDDDAEVQEGTRGLVRAIDRLDSIPQGLLLDCVRSAVIAASDDGASALVDAFLKRHRLQPLLESGAIAADAVGPEVAAIIRHHLEDTDLRGGMPFTQQWQAAEILFEAAFLPGAVSVENAALALDQMERIAHSSAPHAEKWRQLLEGDERVARAFDDPDTLWQARLNAVEMLKQWEAAAQMVLREAEAAFRRGDHERRDELVAWLDDRGHHGIVPPHLRRPEGPAAPRPAAAVQRKPCRVLFIGGDERQAPAAKDISNRLRGSDPTLTVSFARIGWTSNWGREMPSLRSLIADHDIVVLMTFIRTQCGRRLRAAAGEAGKQWRSCTGRGPQSMERAIRLAAATVRGEG